MNIYYVAGVPYASELYHHGILGQKWGVRRFQNKDGTLTAEGKLHYKKDLSTARSIQKNLNKIDKDMSAIKYQKQKTDLRKARLVDKREKNLKNSKLDKLNAKIQKTVNKSNNYKRTLNDYQKLTNDIIEQVSKEGFDVKSKPVIRRINQGKRIAVGTLGIAGALTLSAAFPAFSYTIASHGGRVITTTTISSLPLSPAGSLAGLGVRTHKVAGKKYKVKSSYKNYNNK